MSLEHERTVIAAVLPRRQDRLLWAFSRLDPVHFRDNQMQVIWTLMEQYFDAASHVLPKAALTQILNNNGMDAAKVLLWEETYDELTAMDVPEDAFRWAIESLRDDRAKQMTGEAITMGFEILERGAVIEKEELRGHEAARAYIYAQFGETDRLGAEEYAPEGDIRHEGQDIKAEYASRKDMKGAQGVKTGIPTMDSATAGFQNGELALVCAYTGEGKSMFSTQTAWYTAVDQGKNVYFATSETIRPQVIRRLVARHSRLPQFGMPEGLDTKDLKNGTLNPEQEAVFLAAVNDLGTNPAYGRLHVAQVPRGATISFIESRLTRASAQWSIDLVIIDYLALLRSDRRRESKREEMDDLIKAAKVMATTHDSGRGVPVLSPWAMSQSAWKEAKRTGEYTLANLAETSEAEKSADQIISMLRLPETPQEVSCQFLKNRDGSVPPKFTLRVDYKSTWLGEREGEHEIEDLLDSSLDSMM